MEGVADGVGLDHVAHEAQGQDDGHREEARQELAEAALEGRPDVVDGAAGGVAVVVGGAVLLGQDSLAVDGGHAEEGGDPHPEDGAGAAGVEGGGAAGDVAGAHLGGDGGGQGLEGAHALLARLVAGETDAAEELAAALAELPDLDEAGPDGVEDAGAQQEEEQQKLLVPEDIIDGCHDLCDKFHSAFLLLALAGKRRTGPVLTTVAGSDSARKTHRPYTKGAERPCYSVLLPERFPRPPPRLAPSASNSMDFSRAASVRSPHPSPGT